MSDSTSGRILCVQGHLKAQEVCWPEKSRSNFAGPEASTAAVFYQGDEMGADWTDTERLSGQPLPPGQRLEGCRPYVFEHGHGRCDRVRAMSAWTSVVQARALMGRQGLLGLRGVSERGCGGRGGAI